MKNNDKFKSKIIILSFFKFIGLFHVARHLTRKNLRIICYHGVSITDEHEFNNLLFMRHNTFCDRLDYLKSSGFNVIPLETAIKHLESDSLSPLSTVITVDDGWHHTFVSSVPIAHAHGFPLTVYVTSYYAAAGVCVLNVVVRYLIWKAAGREVDMSGFFSAEEHCCLKLDSSNKDEILNKVLEYVESQPTLIDRKEAVHRIAECLGFDGDYIMNNKVFHLMTEDEIRQAVAAGVDIQLHTHRHRFPSGDCAGLEDEIIKNRGILEPLVGKNLVHLCYPSGVYSPKDFDTLEKLGIKSAVTCESGFITPKTNWLSLPRFLDGENISSIEFEAEMSGVLEILRKIRTMIRRFIN